MNDHELTTKLSAIHQQRRELPDARDLRRALLSVDLDRLPSGRRTLPGLGSGFRGVFTAARLAAAVALLTGAAAFVYAGIGSVPTEEVRAPGVLAVSPSPTAVASDPSPIASTESPRAQTNQVVAFANGTDPVDLAQSPTGALYYLDAAAGEIFKVDADGYQSVVSAASDPYGRSATITAGSRLLATSPRGVFFIHDDGSVWDAQELPTGFNLITMNGDDDVSPNGSPLEPKPPFAAHPVAAAATRGGYDRVRLYALDEAAGSVVSVGSERGSSGLIPTGAVRLQAEGLGPARDLWVGRDLYVLYERAVQRYRDGELDPEFDIGPMPEGTDLRFIAGTSGDGSRLYVLDAASDRLLVLASEDASLIDAWMLDAPGEDVGDLRGLVAMAPDGDDPAAVAWITQHGLYQSTLSHDPVADDPVFVRTDGTSGDDIDPALFWASPSVRLEADALRIRANGRTFHGVEAPELDDWADLHDRELHARWHEDGVEMRISFYLHEDGTDWWIDEIWTYDGRRNGGWIYYRELDAATRTPLGSALEGDLRLDGGTADSKGFADGARLRIDGLRLTAFEPGTGPVELTECIPLPAGLDAEELQRATAGMTLDETEAYFAESGYCREFRYEYTLDPATSSGRSKIERWCVAPPEGEVTWIHRLERALLVWVEDLDLKAKGRKQPPNGWGCPLDDGGREPLPEPRSLPSSMRALTEPALSVPPGGSLGRLGFRIDFETATMLPGERQRMEAKWCTRDGCSPIDVQWSIEDGGATVSREHGSWTTVVARRAGHPSLRVKAPMVDAYTGFSIMPRPGAVDPWQEYGERQPVTYPLKQVLAPGDYFVLTSWGCPSSSARRFGADGRPGTDDDECTVAPIEAASPIEGAGVSVVDKYGPSVLLRVDPETGGDVRFAGVFLRHETRGAAPFPLIYVREGAPATPALGDLDGDGHVDASDLALLGPPGPEVVPEDPDWQSTHDLNLDRRIDAADQAILAALVERTAAAAPSPPPGRSGT